MAIQSVSAKRLIIKNVDGGNWLVSLAGGAKRRPARLETYAAVVQDACEVTVQSCRDLSVTLLLESGDSIERHSTPAFALAGALAARQDAD